MREHAHEAVGQDLGDTDRTNLTDQIARIFHVHRLQPWAAAERLAGAARLEPPEPLYLRRPDARVPGKPKRVTP